MKKNSSSNRSINFIKRNSPNYDKVKDYISNLCDNVFDIINYEFKKYREDEIAFYILISEDEYIIYLDYKYIELKLLKNGKIVKIFCGDTAWYQSLKYLKDNIL